MKTAEITPKRYPDVESGEGEGGEGEGGYWFACLFLVMLYEVGSI